MTNDDTSSLDNLSYEQAFAELESIIRNLEEEDQTLEKTLELFERGQALSNFCANLLQNAELKIQQLTDGVLTDFE